MDYVIITPVALIILWLFLTRDDGDQKSRRKDSWPEENARHIALAEKRKSEIDAAINSYRRR